VNLRIQTVLYEPVTSSLDRFAEALAQSLHVAQSRGGLDGVEIAFGDCSEGSALDTEALERLGRVLSPVTAGSSGVTYQPFGANLGHAGGQNRLFSATDPAELAGVGATFSGRAAGSTTDWSEPDEGSRIATDGGPAGSRSGRSYDRDELLLLLNPDVVVAPTTIAELVDVLANPSVGLAEAHQLPFEHPKEYDPATGSTPWCSLACALTRSSAYADLGGLDSDSFFLYGDDVDYSWRLRLAGYRIIYVARARVFHDKSLTATGARPISPAEERYAVEAELYLSWKYADHDPASPPDGSAHDGVDTEGFPTRRDAAAGAPLRGRVGDVALYYEAEGTPLQQEAVTAFRSRAAAGKLPPPVPGGAAVASFVDGGYARHRFA
jgi:GT2 family glycosyltransferase